MKKIIFSISLIFVAFPLWGSDLNKKIVDHLQSISVTVESNEGSGSGVIKIRKQGEDYIAYVFTGAHVIDGLRKTRTVIDSKTGSPRTIVEFEDAKVIKVLVENGRTIGRLEMFAEVVRISTEEDLALLRVRQKNFCKDSVKFYLDKDIPGLGSGLIHVGSLLGEKLGSNSLTTGTLSQVGRLIDGKIFDQTTVVAFPGSSGGGVYLENGLMIGMLLRGSGENFNFICPVRRIVEWVKSAKIEWSINDEVPYPSEVELKKIPVEDNGVMYVSANSAHKSDSSKKMFNHNLKSIIHLIK